VALELCRRHIKNTEHIRLEAGIDQELPSLETLYFSVERKLASLEFYC
jgi:hypothetical protein